MRDGYRIYDTHTHLGTARHSGRVTTVEAMLGQMDRHGVDRSMLIPYPVVDDHRATHDELAHAVKHHPDRFSAAACLHPFIPEAAFRDEVKRCAEELGFRALKLQPQYQPLNPLSRRSDFFFETALRHGLTVIAHTGAGAPFALPSLFIMPARRYPELNIVLGHSGGGLYAAEAIVAASVCSNIYLELSTLMPNHVAEVLNHLPAERLMAGSDLPECLPVEIDKILHLPLSPGQKQQILWQTGRRIFDGE
jgi:predicted TIM-barrel fold metal-dependent hydrolase